MSWLKKKMMKKQQQLSEQQLRIRITTSKDGFVEVRDQNGNLIKVSRINLYVNTFGKIVAELIVKDVEIDIITNNIRIVNENS